MIDITHEDPTKLDDYTLQTKKTSVAVEPQRYTRNYLLAQKAAIEKQRDEFVAARQLELEEVDGLLKEMDKLGIVEREENEEEEEEGRFFL